MYTHTAVSIPADRRHKTWVGEKNMNYLWQNSHQSSLLISSLSPGPHRVVVRDRWGRHTQWGVSRRGPLKLENCFEDAEDLLIPLLGERARIFSLLWNGSQSAWRERGDRGLLDWLWGGRCSLFLFTGQETICLLTWRDTLSLASKDVFTSQRPFAWPMQKGEILMENILLKKNFGYEIGA